MRLDESMIRVVTSSIDSNGRAVRERRFVVYVAQYDVRDARGRTRRFASPCKARQAAREYIEAHNAMEPEPDLSHE